MRRLKHESSPQATPAAHPRIRASTHQRKKDRESCLCMYSRSFFWCRGPGSNRYEVNPRGILSPLRLPIPPPRRKKKRKVRNADPHRIGVPFLMEAAPGIEPGIKVLQTSALPLGYAATWSGKRDSNPRPQPWQGCALPLSYFRAGDPDQI